MKDNGDEVEEGALEFENIQMDDEALVIDEDIEIAPLGDEELKTEDQEANLVVKAGKKEDPPEEVKEAIFYEAYVDKIAAGIVGSLGWANAGLLNQAFQETFNQALGKKDTEVIGSWIYVVVLFLTAYWFGLYGIKYINACLTACDPDPEDWADEEEAEECKKDEDDDFWIENLIENQVKAFGKTVTDLLVKTLGVSLALAFSDSCVRSVEVTVDRDSDATWFYFGVAILVSLFFIYTCVNFASAIQAADDAEKTEKEESTKTAYTQDEQEKNHFWNLITHTIELVIAMSWRNAFDSLFDAWKDPDAGNWTYAIGCTMIVTMFLTYLEIYLCCVPVNKDSYLSIGTPGRAFAGTTFSNSIRAVVGLAWIDALQAIIKGEENSSSGSIEGQAIYLAIVWLIYLVFEMYLDDVLLRNVIDVKDDFFAFVDRFNDAITVGKLTKEIDEDILATSNACGNFCNAFIELVGYSLKMAAGWSLTPFVKAVIAGMYKDNENQEDQLTGFWASFIISLTISTCISLYFIQSINAARAIRKGVVNKLSGKKVPDYE